MTKVNHDYLAVAALKNGTVIDHIPTDAIFKVADLLGIKDATTSVTIGYNLDSQHMGKKGIIKVADTFYSEADVSRIALVAPHAVINIIKDYEVVEKKQVTLPEEITNIVKCNNPKCITNNEPMKTYFHLVDRDAVTLQCHYCERKVTKNEIVLKG